MPDSRSQQNEPLNTCFTFTGKVFAAPGVRFTRDHASGAMLMHVPLGEFSARLPIAAVRREFGVAPGGPDHELLELADKALDHVEEVRPGDSVPSEIISGAASWRFEPAHHMIARGRLFAHAIAHGEDEKTAIPPRDALLVYEDAEDFEPRFAAALDRISEEIANGVDAKAVRDTLTDLARELAFIEALHDHYAGLFQLPRRFAQARAQVEGDRNRREEYDRMTALLVTPLRQARERFADVERLISDVPGLIRDPGAAVHAVRRARDRLHADTRKWREVSVLWRDDFEGGDEARRAKAYHLLATHFAQGSDWTSAA